MTIESRPYKIKNHIQNYDWGTRGKDAFIPKLLGFEGEEKPYAELWIGGHQKLSSEISIKGDLHNLKDVVEKFPNEILGKEVAKKFGNNIPFLLKVLSADKALSIQTHPNKKEAIELHKDDSKNYPDDNHKPEIAIALDTLSSLVGFRPLEEIENNINKYSQLVDFIGVSSVTQFYENKTKNSLKNLFSTMMNNSKNSENLGKAINELKTTFEGQTEKSEDEVLFLILYSQYGVDIGLLVLFFLNVVNLKPGEAIYTPAGIPHAYLKGNIVECMANSDNVVRAGLSPKFKDIKQLTNILTYEFGKPKLIGEKIDNNIHEYKVPAKEFKVDKIELENESIEFDTNNRIEIILVTEGSMRCDELEIKKGETVLIPALMDKYKIVSNNSAILFKVMVPI